MPASILENYADLVENDSMGDIKDPQVLEIMTFKTKLNIKLGSKATIDRHKSFGSEDVNKESVAETMNSYIIEHSWIQNLPKLALMIFVTRVLPFISMSV
jgi:hypothetical protein